MPTMAVWNVNGNIHYFVVYLSVLILFSKVHLTNKFSLVFIYGSTLFINDNLKSMRIC